jgi:HEAT repeat protein
LTSVDELVADLISRDDTAAEAAVSRLAEQGEATAPAILSLLCSADAEHRWWAVRTLAAMRDPRKDWLLRALGDSDAEVRAAAVLALAAHPDEAGMASLVRTLSDEDNLVAVLAVNALVKIGDVATPLLIEAFDGATRRGCIQIMRALAELRDSRGIKLMMTAMDEDSAALQYWAQQGLEPLGLNMVYMKPD